MLFCNLSFYEVAKSIFIILLDFEIFYETEN